MSKRKQHSPAFKAKFVLELLKSEKTAADLVRPFGVPLAMIHQWKRAFLEAASGVIEPNHPDYGCS